MIRSVVAAQVLVRWWMGRSSRSQHRLFGLFIRATKQICSGISIEGVSLKTWSKKKSSTALLERWSVETSIACRAALYRPAPAKGMLTKAICLSALLDLSSCSSLPGAERPRKPSGVQTSEKKYRSP